MNTEIEKMFPLRLITVTSFYVNEHYSPHFQIIWNESTELNSSPSLMFVRPKLRFKIPGQHHSYKGILFQSTLLESIQSITTAKTPLVLPICPYIQSILFQIKAMISMSSIGQLQYRISGLLFSLIIEFLHLIPQEEESFLSPSQNPVKFSSKNEGDWRIIIYAARYMKKNMSNPDLSLENISDYIGYNPNYFCYEFSKIFSVPPIRFLNKLRLDHSLQLLEQSNYPIKEICRLVGIRNPGRLSSLVKTRVGMTPVEYRHALKLKKNFSIS